MKELIFKLTGAFLTIVLMVGQISANLPCMCEYYQPKVPAQLKRKH